MWVATWNVNYPGRMRTLRQGELLRKLQPDLILLQETNPRSAEALRLAAGADWLIPASNLTAHHRGAGQWRIREGSRSLSADRAPCSPGSSPTYMCRSASCSPRSPWPDAN